MDGGRTDNPKRHPGESRARTGVEDCSEFTQGT